MFGRILNLKGILTLFLGSLLLAGSLGISHMGMSMDMDGSMTDCPFLPGVSICMMSPLEMVAASQSFLGEIVLNTDSSLLLLLASATAISTAFFTFFSPPQVVTRFRVRKQKHRARFSFLEEAFSNGILNPKLY